MRLGCTSPLENIDAVKAAGFDFIEVNIQGVLKGGLDDDAWQADAPDPAKLALPIEAANCLVPGSHKIVGPDRDLDLLKTYMQRVAKRARQLGIDQLVFGSGGARKSPEGVTPAQAFEHILDFTKLAGDACGEHGVTLVIEHLNKGETNTINRLHQARELCDKANNPAVRVLVDSYHYGLENENDDAIIALEDRITHVHLAEPIDRIQPGGHTDPSKAFDFEAFFFLLQKVGYTGRLSLECKFTDSIEANGPETVAFIQEKWQSAGSSAV